MQKAVVTFKFHFASNTSRIFYSLANFNKAVSIQRMSSNRFQGILLQLPASDTELTQFVVPLSPNLSPSISSLSRHKDAFGHKGLFKKPYQPLPGPHWRTFHLHCRGRKHHCRPPTLSISIVVKSRSLKVGALNT